MFKFNVHQYYHPSKWSAQCFEHHNGLQMQLLFVQRELEFILSEEIGPMGLIFVRRLYLGGVWQLCWSGIISLCINSMYIMRILHISHIFFHLVTLTKYWCLLEGGGGPLFIGTLDDVCGWVCNETPYIQEEKKGSPSTGLL